MDTKLIISAILVFCVLLTGMWLSLLGRPLNTIVFSFHKIFAIAAVVLIVLSVLDLQRGIQLQSAEVWAIILSGVFMLLVLASGALLSFEGLVSNVTKFMHKLTPYLAVASIIITVIVLLKHKA
jgi:hypothetical protein